MRIGPIAWALLWALVAVAGPVPAQAAGPVAPENLVLARLVPEKNAVAPGETLWVDLHIEVKPDWHIYWRDPGDSGLPTAIEWSLPPGFSAGEIEWPVPEHFVVGTLGNYGYAGKSDLLIPITAPATLAGGGPVHLKGTASWLACSEICIPGEAKLALDLRAAAAPAASDAGTAALFAAARQELPEPAKFETRFSLAADRFTLLIPAASLGRTAIAKASFFPFDANLIDNAAEPRIERSADDLRLSMAAAKGAAAAKPATVAGVLELVDGAGAKHGFTIAASPTAAPIGEREGTVWWQALVLAFLGGVVLNLMPCVFPVLSLKVLSLSGLGDRTEQWRHGAAYAAGVVLSFAALGVLLLSLRAGGAAIGWGFQLQSPVVVGVLAYLLFAMGLSLSGVAEFGIGLAGVGGRFAERSGVAGAFATGVLATLVATPCTAPFMGTALGVALIAAAPLALAIFVSLGLGLAAPFVLLTTVPALRRLLPRPGPWMALFKQLLAFPLYGTVAWLIWVLIQEAGPRGSLAALLGLVCVGFAVWVYGRTQLARPAARRLGLGLAAASVIAALVMAATAGPAGADAASAGGRHAARDGLSYEAFEPGRLAALAAEHKPVFVNLTAAWCLTCLLNEQATLDSAAVRRAFATSGVVALKGDWTRQNPEITAFLQQFGRSGVPLYLLYDRGGNPTVLPQILTETTVLAAIDKL